MAIKTAPRKIKASPQAMRDTYFNLIRQFPLARIRDASHLAEASGVIDQLLGEMLDEGESAYLDALTDLVEVYEDEHVKIPVASEAEVLRELMDANGYTQAMLAKDAGISQSSISAVLRGKRSLTRSHVVRLATLFHVPASLFMQG